MDKRFIEESFPVKEVSEGSAKEKSIKRSHISTLHIWWARKPLTSSRAINFASLIPAPQDEIDWVKKKNFIIELSKWENSLNHKIIEEAKKEIFKANNGVAPKVLDPFSGGGSIPLEALRLGCDTYANDYNPVAVLIERCLLEYPQKFGQSINEEWSEGQNRLIKDVKKWSKWVFTETKKELGKFYPEDDDKAVSVGFYWVKTIKCENPACNCEIPLITNWWLSKNKGIFIFPNVENGKINYQIIENGDVPKNFDPSKGTTSRAIAKCVACGFTIDAKKTRLLFQEKKSGHRMIAVILKYPNKKGKVYRKVNENDLKVFNDAITYLKSKENKLISIWGIDPVPNETLPLMSGVFNVPLYGLNTWGDLFNYRQKLALITFIEKIHASINLMKEENYEMGYIKAIISYLALAVDRLADYNSVLCIWHTSKEILSHTFGRQALGMVWDYFEVNPFSDATGNWNNSTQYILDVINHVSNIKTKPAHISFSNAISLNYPDNYFDAVFTDPPYYNSVPYADLSDFFYVWLKRSLGKLDYELFSTPLTPKSNEIAEMKGWDNNRYSHKDKHFFESMLKKAFREIYRVLKPNGVATIVYAHKTTDGWETVINALLDSGLTITASWPVSTEMKERLRAKNSATLASSIYIVARKIDKKDLGWFKNIKDEIKIYIPQKLDKLWEEGISGADFFIAAIGSAIEIFGKYEKILDNEGNEIRANKLLNFLRDVVTDYAVRQILHNGIIDELSSLSKFYLLWRWNYGEIRVPFDEARKLAQSAGIDLTNEWNKGFIMKRGEFITILGPDKRDVKTLENSKELIDVLHYVCLLWKSGHQEELKKVIKITGFGDTDALYKVAQAISETLPNSSSEKKLIEGFLAGKNKLIPDTKEDKFQTKLT